MTSHDCGTPTPSFQIISSLRYDPELPRVTGSLPTDEYFPVPRHSPYYLLSYHRDRLINAAKHFQWDEALESLQKDLSVFEDFLNSAIENKVKSWRLRILVDRHGKGLVEVNPVGAMDCWNLLVPPLHKSVPDVIWNVYVDSQATIPSGFTTHKTTARDDYSAARARAGITSPADTSEVLLVNPDGQIMEGSITTPYFRRRVLPESHDTSQPTWVTPPLKCGGNAGTSRRYALEQSFCVEQLIMSAELVDGEDCWLSNGVRGFVKGVVILT
ncbi:hypothetical protein N7539_001724 [Penicillium diatomitis]|uniref:Aminodeoxychorismate lyase n=1 Tax=Penicillium diatomitis TaxID=2819901 RepID=A0A9W9XHA4_9EURO|nr:uncharacterized protein N7539_001724 [Penicillium diatomitis]KAJ5492978.1 hypothetical protein N7539_001724 [Penicillium diatomitis]